jgi:glycosyltransferase involved in cell wall biosynthesis
MKRPKDQPLVSIIMNCYNGEKYLGHAIQSVLAQSYQNWEVIFWDNQSVDNSAGIFESSKDSRLHYYYSGKHTVLGEARNCALLECRGDLVAFLDVDDWWFPGKLELQVPLFRDEAVGMSCGNYILVNERGGDDANGRSAYENLPTGYVLNDLLDDCFVHMSSLVVRKRAITSLSYPFDSRFNIIEDFDLLVRLSVEWRMASVQIPISYYRWHRDNTGYKTDFLISEELNVWYDEGKDNTIYRNQKNFSKFERKVKYYDVLRMLYNGKRREAFWRIKDITPEQRMKTFIGILLPTRIVRKWMDRS